MYPLKDLIDRIKQKCIWCLWKVKCFLLDLYPDKIWQQFGNEGPSLALLKRLHKPFRFKLMHQTISHDIWEIYLSCLIANQKEQTALHMMNRYIDLFGVEHLPRWLLLTEFAHSHFGITNPQLEKALRLLQSFRENEENQTLSKLIDGRTIAIVGNGPQEMGKGKGHEIDSHDLVVRFNNYQTAGFEQDYGSRTDIWIRGFGGDDVRDYTATNTYRYAGITGDYSRFPIFWDFQFEIYYRDFVEKGLIGGYIGPQLYSQCRTAYKGDPTSGCNTIYTLVLLAPRAKFDFYAFSFFQQPPPPRNVAIHYFNDRSQEEEIRRTANHNLAQENKFLIQFLQQHKVGKYETDHTRFH